MPAFLPYWIAVMPLIDRDGLINASGLAEWQADIVLKLLKMPELTTIYDRVERQHGIDLIEDALADQNILLDYDEDKLERVLPVNAPFITVSNHPFGFLDGIILLLIIGRKRPEYRAVANFLLAYFEPLSDLFITVNPFENSGPKAMGGTQKSLDQLNKGLGLGLFPAGEVSTWYKGQKGIQDRDWSLSSMRLIKRAAVPVIPIYFDSRNSLSFHLLGKLHPMLRTLRIPAEFLKKRNNTIRIVVGDAIEPASMADLSDEALAKHLKHTTYSLGKS
ncbi:1-acyl-sn-glycerol-3-phosphate acyltransferase [Thalassolituus maritimus]